MDKRFLEEYLNGYSPVGYEANGQKLLVEYLRKYTDKVYDDNYGNIIGVINSEAEYKVVLDAHIDEVAFIVNHINKNGYLYIVRSGGSDAQIAPSKTVNIFTQSGTIIEGVVGYVPIHLRSDMKDFKPEIDKLWIDVGADNDEEVEKMGISIGDCVIFDDKFKILNKNKICARSLDDKIGVFIHSQVIKKLYENKDKLPFGLYIVNSVQEEIGLRGAQMATQSIKPNIALVFDVTHNTNIPHVSIEKIGNFKLGDGVVFCQSPGIHKNLNKLLIETAKKNNIKYKLNIKPGSTGTNSDSYTYSNGGVITALISIAISNMHTSVEIANLEDIELAINLIYNVLLKIENNHNFKYLNL